MKNQYSYLYKTTSICNKIKNVTINSGFVRHFRTLTNNIAHCFKNMEHSKTIAQKYIELLYPKLTINSIDENTVKQDNDITEQIKYLINIYLVSLIYTDYREYLELSKIITAHHKYKNELRNMTLKSFSTFEFMKLDINEINHILFKEKNKEIKKIIQLKYHLTPLDTDKLFLIGGSIFIYGLYQQMLFDKKNIGGLIDKIRNEQASIIKNLDANAIQLISEIKIKNRQRLRTYIRGEHKIKYTEVYYSIAISCVLFIIIIIFWIKMIN